MLPLVSCTPARLHASSLFREGAAALDAFLSDALRGKPLARRAGSPLCSRFQPQRLYSKLIAHSSGLRTLSSPNAKRQSSGMFVHNTGESLAALLLPGRSSHLALQAASRPIADIQRSEKGLTDCLTPSSLLQKRLSGASNGMSTSALLLVPAAIHNVTLSIKKRVPCGNLAFAHPRLARRHLSQSPQKTSENQKMETSIFLVFTHTKPGPWIGQLVKAGSLSGCLDKVNDLWNTRHLWPSAVCCGYSSRTRNTRKGAVLVTRSLLDTYPFVALAVPDFPRWFHSFRGSICSVLSSCVSFLQDMHNGHVLRNSLKGEVSR